MKTVLFFVLILGMVSCTKKPSSSPEGAQAMTTQQLAERGRVIYVSNCIACHHVDPKKVGSVGPEVWGSSLELIQARVMRAAYPEGYKAKRETHMMVALPHLEKELAALHAYLNQ